MNAQFCITITIIYLKSILEFSSTLHNWFIYWVQAVENLYIYERMHALYQIINHLYIWNARVRYMNELHQSASAFYVYIT